jgi:hypothetical protein
VKEIPCDRCQDKPCKNNPYNEDQECWQGHVNRDALVKAYLERQQKKKKTR